MSFYRLRHDSHCPYSPPSSPSVTAGAEEGGWCQGSAQDHGPSGGRLWPRGGRLRVRVRQEQEAGAVAGQDGRWEVPSRYRHSRFMATSTSTRPTSTFCTHRHVFSFCSILELHAIIRISCRGEKRGETLVMEASHATLCSDPPQSTNTPLT